MTTSNSSPASINHPPLAYDSQGCKVAVPAGTTHWRIQRFTAGRPKTMPGRFELDLTPEQLLELCGPGRYRVDALDQFGQALAIEVATVVVGMASDTLPTEPVVNATMRVAPSSDMRFMLETLSQMSRAHSESLQSLANAQADWIKMLATAKQIPRNAASPIPLQLGPPPTMELADPEPWWAQLLKPQTLAGVTGLLRNVAPWFGFKSAAEEPKRRNGTAMPHLGNLKSVPRIEASSKSEASALPDFAEHMAAVCTLVPAEHVALVRAGLLELQRSNNFIDMLLFLSKPPVEAAAWVIEELVTKPAAEEKSS